MSLESQVKLASEGDPPDPFIFRSSARMSAHLGSTIPRPSASSGALRTPSRGAIRTSSTAPPRTRAVRTASPIWKNNKLFKEGIKSCDENADMSVKSTFGLEGLKDIDQNAGVRPQPGTPSIIANARFSPQSETPSIIANARVRLQSEAPSTIVNARVRLPCELPTTTDATGDRPGTFSSFSSISSNVSGIELADPQDAEEKNVQQWPFAQSFPRSRIPRSGSYTVKRLSAKKSGYGPTLTVSDDADAVLLGSGSPRESPEPWITPLNKGRAPDESLSPVYLPVPNNTPATTKAGPSATKRFVNRIRGKNVSTPAISAPLDPNVVAHRVLAPLSPNVVAHRVLDSARDATDPGISRQLIAISEALIKIIQEGIDAGRARERAIQAATVAEGHASAAAEQVQHLLEWL